MSGTHIDHEPNNRVDPVSVTTAQPIAPEDPNQLTGIAISSFRHFPRLSVDQIRSQDRAFTTEEVIQDCNAYLDRDCKYKKTRTQVAQEKYEQRYSRSGRIDAEKEYAALPFSERVIDEKTASNVDFPIFFKRVFGNRGIPSLVESHLRDSLKHPPTKLSVSIARQDAVKEVCSDAELSHGLRRYANTLNTIQESLEAINSYLESPVFSCAYHGFQRGCHVLKELVAGIEQLPEVESPYVNILLERIRDLENSEVYQCALRGISRTYTGFAPLEDNDSKLGRFYPYPVTELQNNLLVVASACSLGAAGVMGFASLYGASEAWTSGVVAAAGAAATIVVTFIGNSIRSTADKIGVVTPFLQQILDDERFKKALDAAARLGEIYEYSAIRERTNHQTCFPQLVDGENHCFQVREMVSPAEIQNPAYVPTDIDLGEQAITFITGPNSAGKTSSAKNIIYTQLLGQNGAPVLCQEATIGIAESVSYRSRITETIEDRGGELHTSLAETAETVKEAGPKSLILLDEPAKGTSSAESDQVTKYRILDPLRILGSTTLVISHKFELAKLYEEHESENANYLQLEVIGTKPTRRIVPGIAESSLANVVADEAGLSYAELQELLERRAAKKE